VERSPLFCVTCDADLVLDEIVFAYRRLEGHGAPQFVHVECGPPNVRRLRRAGPRLLRSFVLEHLRRRRIDGYSD